MSEEDGRKELQVRIITPERTIFEGEAKLLRLRIADGDIGIMADHQPIVSTVDFRGVHVVDENDERRVFAVSDGFFKVSENLAQILVERAVPAEEIDPDAAEEEVEEAYNALAEVDSSDDDAQEAMRRREELERRLAMGENMSRVASRYGGES